ncbi:MAG: hypothetical protein A2Y07_02010 [Planctomycetes bacterium GWF2_50_10]|nr:MAG: hypothetical protein A2Y07_02010 [Planctomycetes bacterium GWF2_50_10]
MAKQDFSGYQKKIIERYYENMDTIALTNLQELVSEIYLADSPKKKEKLWERVAKSLVKLKIPTTISTHILTKQDPAILAKNVTEWLANSKKR